jgi:hypothetical protein
MPNKRIKRFAIAVLAFVSAPLFANQLSVLLPNQSIRLDYGAPARLETVLRDAHTQAVQRKLNYIPIQSQLFATDKQSLIDAKKQELITRLQELAISEPDVGAEKVEQLLKQSEFHYREFISLDFDKVQSQIVTNPLLSGHYQLVMTSRKNDVHFVGALSRPATVSQQAQWFLADYFDALGELKLDSASSSIAYVIQPDGEVQVARYGNYNFQPHYIAPGATIYVPFDSLPSKFESLNQDIAQLLRHKVVNND